jgi:hypothetical protein
MKLLFSFKAMLSDSGACTKIEHLQPLDDIYDFMAFYQWDNVIEKATRECAQEKRGKKVEFSRVGKDYLLYIIIIEDDDLCNFKFDIYEKS